MRCAEVYIQNWTTRFVRREKKVHFRSEAQRNKQKVGSHHSKGFQVKNAFAYCVRGVSHHTADRLCFAESNNNHHYTHSFVYSFRQKKKQILSAAVESTQRSFSIVLCDDTHARTVPVACQPKFQPNAVLRTNSKCETRIKMKNIQKKRNIFCVQSARLVVANAQINCHHLSTQSQTFSENSSEFGRMGKRIKSFIEGDKMPRKSCLW